MEVEALKRILGFEDTADLTIINACYDSVPSEIAILIACTGCSSSRIFYLVGYDEDRGSWFLRDFFLPAPLGVILNMAVLYSASSSMLLWDKDKVYHSYKGNRVNGYIKVADTDKILSAVAEGTTIHQIIIDFNGNTVIKMKNNVMFYLKFNMKDVIRLNAWEAESKNYVFYSIPHHELFLLKVNGSDIHLEIYPLKTEILSATHPLKEVCPYISFQHSMRHSSYHMDMGERLTFWTQIVFLENLGLYTDIKIYRPELLKQETYLQYEIARGICTKNMTVTFYHHHDYSKAVSYEDTLVYTSGVMAIEMKPSTTGRTCFSNNKMSFINVGCSSSRYLEIEKYENADAINIVQSNYVLWEVNGRNDFHYNSTMEQNYKSCFMAEEDFPGDLNKPYEIMNHSGINSVIWPQYYTGIFMFRVIIVDPNFSFCMYETNFAVRTYGIIKRPNMFKIAGWSILIVTLFLGVLIFSYFRYVKIFRSLSFVDPLLSLDLHLHATVSSEEKKEE
ncbi:cation channel sperm-associated auxiliary subunit epsilon-like [Elgaria multicarinata webbii]|uniref:cation channel sperm-associated auxiliary subunit epsilon-like n=1 Tax=Elgaria multicarinata webbii TaxID=159646 RepID=UPI002FCD100D